MALLWDATADGRSLRIAFGTLGCATKGAENQWMRIPLGQLSVWSDSYRTVGGVTRLVEALGTKVRRGRIEQIYGLQCAVNPEQAPKVQL